ncbi:hypothetical protein [Amycolatopsis sp. DSM 110486]|uniref:hypothetical protein n=1 Tax=Amycolatopsis sp. DSM 110486 TaxID=2865832 RepID=UPI001C6A12CA|nr:hypothetical protein [Amycolatopsis sp. DSM 110486]QYN17490.1 hypothetical protein K1T34_32410 [Amycolatopsis sp. DSM 110486]
MPRPTMREALGDEIVRNINRTAAQLRELADQIERDGASVARIGTPGVPTAGSIAARVVHAVHNGLAGMALDGLIRAAGNFDTHAKDDTSAG